MSPVLSRFRKKFVARKPPVEMRVMGAKAMSQSSLPISLSRTSRPGQGHTCVLVFVRQPDASYRKKCRTLPKVFSTKPVLLPFHVWSSVTGRLGTQKRCPVNDKPYMYTRLGNLDFYPCYEGWKQHPASDVRRILLCGRTILESSRLRAQISLRRSRPSKATPPQSSNPARPARRWNSHLTAGRACGCLVFRYGLICTSGS